MISKYHLPNNMKRHCPRRQKEKAKTLHEAIKRKRKLQYQLKNIGTKSFTTFQN